MWIQLFCCHRFKRFYPTRLCYFQEPYLGLRTLIEPLLLSHIPFLKVQMYWVAEKSQEMLWGSAFSRGLSYKEFLFSASQTGSLRLSNWSNCFKNLQHWRNLVKAGHSFSSIPHMFMAQRRVQATNLVPSQRAVSCLNPLISVASRLPLGQMQPQAKPTPVICLVHLLHLLLPYLENYHPEIQNPEKTKCSH